ncbi:unnamed protein product, partial [Ilex paraguariensis]
DQVTRVVLGVGKCENGLYVLDQNHHAFASVVSSNKLRASVHLWHAWLDHPSFRTVDDGLGDSFPQTSHAVSPVHSPSLPTPPISIPTTSTNTHSM